MHNHQKSVLSDWFCLSYPLGGVI